MTLFRIFLGVLLFLLHSMGFSQSLESNSIENIANITIDVNHILNNKGKVIFTIFDSKQNFDAKIPLQKLIGDIKELTSTVTFKNLPFGNYAIICFHDINENDLLDFDGFFPVEDYGVSNNIGKFGPPQFEAAMFHLNELNLNIEISFY